MLQYLLNTTAIWLVSLVMFDVFLQRESYHNYNRFYLLFTFLLGVFLPLLKWQDNREIYTSALGKPLQQVITLKQNIVTSTTPTTTSVSWQQWLTIIYLAGVFIALCLLAIEIIKLSTAYTAKRSQQDGWTIIETGKEHAPFSFLNTLFVCSIDQYNDEEWNMIVVHEKRHTSLFHVADLVLMQLARVIFWFHPLVYLYDKRLLLVHEYQADNASTQQPQLYGRFLVEQAILQSAPALSHSFNRSPIKNRILMLTRRSSAAARTKMLVFIPLLMVCILCFSKNIFSQGNAKKKALDAVMLTSHPDTAMYKHHLITNYDLILSDPQLVSVHPGAKVTSFAVSFQPKGKDYLGPYTVSGSSRLDHNPRIMEILNNLKANDTEVVRMYIEEIHVNYNDKDSTEPWALIYRIHPQQ